MFDVTWEDDALDELADAWLQADSPTRQAITAASQEIDQRLRNDPSNEGESRLGNRRIAFFAPLIIRYHVEEDNARVRILQVRLLRSRA